jgi:cell division protease FtsH
MTLATFLGYTDVYSWLQSWLPIIFMGLLVVAVFWLMRLMPKTGPSQIKPDSSPQIGWSEIAGADEAKDELRGVVDYLRHPKRFREIGARVPNGILLHGPPGTGKTLLAKAVAHESGATFFSQSAASFVEMFAGLGAARIRRLFKAARNKSPAIVFIDETRSTSSTPHCFGRAASTARSSYRRQVSSDASGSSRSTRATSRSS